MRPAMVLTVICLGLPSNAAAPAGNAAGPRTLNNLVTVLAHDSSITGPTHEASFDRSDAGWIFVSATRGGNKGTVTLTLKEAGKEAASLLVAAPGDARPDEAFHFVAKGKHAIVATMTDGARLDELVVKAVPELIHCGLGFDPAIKGYGRYDMDFLRRDILPNVTTLLVPHNIALPPETIDAWRRQGKRFVGEVGINGQAKSAAEHAAFWLAFIEKAPFLDGVIINEFIVNNPSVGLSPERRERMEREREQYRDYEKAIRLLVADARFKGKTLYAYFGGSGKRLNQEVIGPTFVKTLIDSDCRIALERYLFEVSSEQKSKDALSQFVDGVADWEVEAPGAKKKMVVAFGLFSMPPGGINKQPNVDYHVWMDQQMNALANDPKLAGVGGIEWWTTILADEETTRFVGRLYRHYAIEGKTSMLTKDPLLLPHIQNADFERGLEGWELKPAEEGSIAAKSFPRYGRIEGRYMGLGRPADPEHIGDTFLLMKRSPKGPNTFSQSIKNLTPGRLYSMKMFSCDHADLIHPRKKTIKEAKKFVGRVTLDGVELDTKRSFNEMYSSNPEPPIPVWITYHWKVFRAKGETATLTVSDWPSDKPEGPYGLEQTFNFLEIQPYHE